MKMHLRLALPLAALALAACGQKTTTPPASKLYTKLGVVQAFKSETRSGVLARFATITPAALPELTDPSTLDTCQLGNGGNALTQLLAPATNSVAGSLDAGQAITFKKNGMAFATLARTDLQPQTAPNYVYEAQNLVLSGLSDLTLNIPGASGGFPAFSDVPFSVAAPAFKLTAPTDLGAVTPTTTFAWTGASNDPAAVVLLAVLQDNTPFFFCTARDDGSFTIPSDFRDVLNAQKFVKGTVAALQNIVHLKTSGDALLVTQSLSSVGLF